MEKGTIAIFKLTGEKVMILRAIPVNELYGAYEAGFMVRFASTLQEGFVREYELEKANA